MALGFLGLGFLSGIIQGFNGYFNAKNQQTIQKKTAEIEKQIQEEGFDAARKRYDELCKERKDIAEIEYNASIARANALHQNNLMNIEHTSSLNDWPLLVLPMALHNDQFILKSENFNEQNAITPITIFSGPCKDSSFHKNIWKKAEEHLAQLLLNFWSMSSSHPIIYYQDAWKDDKIPIDGTHCANIHTKVSNIPTIIISPILTKNHSLQIEITHWSITNTRIDISKPSLKESFRLSLPQDSYQYKRDDNYHNLDCNKLAKELASFLAINIGIISDIYMWNSYHITPLIPTLHKKDIVSISNYNNYKQIYCNILQNSLLNGDINALIDLDLALSYCNAVDYNNDETQAFSILYQKITFQDNSLSSKNIFKDIPKYDNSLLKSILHFCKHHQNIYNIDCNSLEDLEILITYNDILPKVKQVAKDKFSYPNNFQTKLVSTIRTKISLLKTKYDNKALIFDKDYSEGKISKGDKYQELFLSYIYSEYTKTITELSEIILNRTFIYAKKMILGIISQEIKHQKSNPKHTDILKTQILNELLFTITFDKTKVNISKLAQDYAYDVIKEYTWNVRSAHLEYSFFSVDTLRSCIDTYFIEKANNYFNQLLKASINIINTYLSNLINTNGYTKTGKEIANISPIQKEDMVLNPYLSILQFHNF